MNHALTVRSFGRYGIGREMPLPGPHALRDYCRKPGLRCEITRYYSSGGRMTHRGAAEVSLVTDHCTATVTIAARRMRAYVAPVRCDRCGAAPASDSAADAGAVLCATCEIARAIRHENAATIEPENDGAYHELAPMPTPRLHLEPQAVPLRQSSFV